jgi:UDPglucose 6-dehydrogenase
MKIAVIGSGYVGLVSGACFSDFGHVVVCVDKDAAKIDALKSGHIPIYEPGLDALVAGNVRAGRLSFTTNLKTGIRDADAVFIAVGTPARKEDGHADLSYIYAAAKEIAETAEAACMVVTKSTVPVGTGDKVEAILREARPELDWAVVSNPEFLREGAALHDFNSPDRIVVGTESAAARELMREIYRPLVTDGAALLFTGRRTSELIKYASNAFLATKIGFINELADLAEEVGADIQDVSKGMGLDRRIGAQFLNAGPGYGGSCFPKDTLALLKTAQDHAVSLRIADATVDANTHRKDAMARKVLAALGGSAKDKRVGVLGLTFKPNTDDMRDAPSIPIIKLLRQAGAEIVAHDPAGMAHARASFGDDLDCRETPYEVAKDADVLVLMTEWNDYRALDLKRLARSMRRPVLVDLRNVYVPADAQRAGLTYHGVGRGSAAFTALSLKKMVA